MQFKQSHVFCIQGAKQMNIDVPFETIFRTTVASRSLVSSLAAIQIFIAFMSYRHCILITPFVLENVCEIFVENAFDTMWGAFPLNK